MFSSLISCSCAEKERPPIKPEVVTCSCLEPAGESEKGSSFAPAQGRLLPESDLAELLAPATFSHNRAEVSAVVGRACDSVFVVELTRSYPEEHIGLDVVPQGEMARVRRVDGKGLIGKYNKVAAPEVQVRQNDLILSVNELSHFHPMEASLRKGLRLRVEVLRQQAQLLMKQGSLCSTSTFASDTEAEPNQVFTVKLRRASLDIAVGLKLLPFPDLSHHESQPRELFQVAKVYDQSVVQGYNMTVPSDRKILLDDLVLSVNGHRGSNTMLESLKSDLILEVEVARPLLGKVTIKRDGLPLGLELTTLVDSGCLIVADIGNGAVAEHNKLAPVDQQLAPNSSIIGVNGQRGTSAELLQFIQASEDEVEVQLLRMPLLQ